MSDAASVVVDFPTFVQNGPPGPPGDGVSTLSSLMGVNPTDGDGCQLTVDGRSGTFVFRAGNLSAQVASDPLQGLYIATAADPSGTSGAWVRQWDGIHGRPEWFGAVSYPANEDWASLTSAQQAARTASAAATRAGIEACRDLCSTTRLAAARYYTDTTIHWNASDRALLGAACNYGGSLASELCVMSATATVLEFGAASYAAVVRGQTLDRIAFTRTVPATGSTGDAEDGVKGVLVRYTTNSVVSRCRVKRSPIGFHVTLTGTCNLLDCNVEPAASTANDICVAFLFGGYAAYPGFVGANGSLRAEGNTAFGFPASTYRAHTLIYGLGADTWLDKAEGSLGGNGIEVTGIDKASMVNYLAGGTGSRTVPATASASQDITISNCRMDGFAGVANYFHHLNASTSINVHNPYVASSGTAFAAGTVAGRIDIQGGEALASTTTQGGGDFNSVGMLRFIGTYLRDFAVPVRVASCLGAEIAPQIYNFTTPTATAVQLLGVTRCSVRPAVRGAASMFTNGITADSATAYSSIDGSRIDPGCFSTVDAAYKVRFNGQDAKPGGAGNSAFTAAGNFLSGVTG